MDQLGVEAKWAVPVASSDDLLPPKPEEPSQADCCGTGCIPCVFDIYDQELKLWEEDCRKVMEGASITKEETEADSSDSVLSLTEYRPFAIQSISVISHDTKLYRFSLPTNGCLGLQVGQHIIMRSRGLPSTVTRQYTPVSCVSLRGSFDVLIKVYPKGKMSQYVKDWKVGEEVYWRGPFGQLTYKQNQYKRIIMLAAGTGIAPMVQVIQHILDNEADETLVKLHYGCRSFADIILKYKLDEWSSYWNFSVEYFLSEDTEVNVIAKKKYCDRFHIGRISRHTIQQELGDLTLPSTLVLISGTKSFDKDMINFCTKTGLSQENIFKF
ncbi:NADH-cytochrome b5 reductase-like [Lineus longissimus]|uniref:NADH-cytochrome b5 reductase-like n=1 Tax=Lineus longissimus TaxID=88925 RepID=UPI002B4D4C06